MEITPTMSNSSLKECTQFLQKFGFQRSASSYKAEVIENDICIVRFDMNECTGLRALYTHKQLGHQFDLRDIIEFYFPAAERKIFETLFYRNLERNKVFALMIKILTDFLAENKPEIFTDKNEWSAALSADLQLKKNQVDFVFRHFLRGHPIKRQLYDNNPVWRTNLENYLTQNKISLQMAPKPSFIRQLQRLSKALIPFNGKLLDPVPGRGM